MREPTDTERHRAAEGFSEAWRIAAGHTAKDNVLRASGAYRARYLPAAFPAVATDLARLAEGDERAALAFANKWGLLGYVDMATREPTISARERARAQAMGGGDPLPWVWAHARGIRVCLELLHYLQRADEAGLTAYLDSLGGSFESDGSDLEESPEIGSETVFGDLQAVVEEGFPKITYARRTEITTGVFSAFWAGASESPNRAAAREIIQAVLLPNLPRQILPSSAEAHPLAEGAAMVALIEACYWHLARFVRGERRLGRCEAADCRSFFPRTDERQRFCPPEGWPNDPGEPRKATAISKCARRTEMRKLRDQRKGRN